MASQPSRLVLYSRPWSNCSARVRIAASLKNIPLEIVDYKPQGEASKPHNALKYFQKHHNATVPTLEAYYSSGEPLVLTQSLGMLEFLEESYPGVVRLIPPVTNMAARSKVRDLALLVACDIQPLLNPRVYDRLKRLSKLAHATRDARHVEEDETQRKIRKIWIVNVLTRMRVYEAIAKESAGEFSVGDEVSIADVCLVAIIQSLYGHGMRFNEERGYSTIERIVKTCEGIDAFSRHNITKFSELKGLSRSHLFVSEQGSRRRLVRRLKVSPGIGTFESIEELLDGD